MHAEGGLNYKVNDVGKYSYNYVVKFEKAHARCHLIPFFRTKNVGEGCDMTGTRS